MGYGAREHFAECILQSVASLYMIDTPAYMEHQCPIWVNFTEVFQESVMIIIMNANLP